MNGCETANRIRQLGQRYGSVIAFRAYLDQKVTPYSTTLRSQLQSSGVSLTDCPRPDRARKEVADKMILADMMAFAYDNPQPAVVILISGDGDFAYAVSVLRSQLYSVILVHQSSNAHSNLVAQPDIAVNGDNLFGRDWEKALAVLPTLVHKEPASIRSRAIEPTTNSPGRNAVPRNRIEESPTEALIVEVASIGDTGAFPQSSPPPEIAPTSEEAASAVLGAHGSGEEQQERQATLSRSNTASTVATVASVSPDAIIPDSPPSSGSLYEAPPPIPPRPPTHPSARIDTSKPSVVSPKPEPETSEVNDPLAEKSGAVTEFPSFHVAVATDSEMSPENVPSLVSPSTSAGSSSSRREIPELFVDLVDVLDQAHSIGIEYLNSETVQQMVLHRSPNLLNEVGVRRFESFLKLAQEQGIVEYSRRSLGVRLKELWMMYPSIGW
ncbi:hypothetical protein FRB90_010791 [Tulasnella sp. 427]|nr:hypothetical protein FRB90_010791 [Tulasnella sp. 427]